MIELSNEKLIKYVECVKNIETSLYSQKKALLKMKEEEKRCRILISTKAKPFEIPEIEKNDEITFGTMVMFIWFGIVLGVILGFFFAVFGVLCEDAWAIFDLFFGGTDAFDGKVLPKVIGGIIIGAVSGFLIALYKKKKEDKWIKAKNEKNRGETIIRNQKIEQLNKKVKETAMIAAKQLPIIKAEQDVLNSSIVKTEYLLNEFYSLDIIYPKYRGFIHICSIYEYLITGKCDSLSGPYGVYNKLDDDIKFGKLMEKLDIIIQNLEDIKENQRELYYAIKEVGSQIENLGNAIGKISNSISVGVEKLDSINDYLENIDYNTKNASDYQQFTAMYHYFKN